MRARNKERERKSTLNTQLNKTFSLCWKFPVFGYSKNFSKFPVEIIQYL